QRQETRRSRLDQRRGEDVEGAKTHAQAAQRGAGLLIERLDVVRDLAAIDQAEILDEAERDAARNARQLVGSLEVEQRLEQRLDLEAHEALGTRHDLFASRARQLLVGEQDYARCKRIIASNQSRDR